MSNTYITFSHPDVNNGNELRFTAILADSAPFGQLSPRKLDIAADGTLLITLAPRTYTTHTLRLIIDTRDDASYGRYDDLVAYFKKAEVTMRNWHNQLSTVLILNEKLDPIWLTPDGSILFVNLDVIIR